MFRRYSTGPSFRSLSNCPSRLPDGLLDIHALSPWSWRAPSAGTCVSSSITVNVEYNDGWWLPKQTGNANYVHVWCSAALQKLRFESLSSSVHPSSDIFFPTVGVFVQGRETGFTAPGDLLAICCGSSGKEDTRGARLRDEIPELLVDAQASPGQELEAPACLQSSQGVSKKVRWFPRRSQKQTGWSTVVDPLLGAHVRVPQPPWHVFDEESRS